MTNMVSRFRVKKLSPKHPLPIYKESQLPDLVDPANVIQRAVPQIETGVEKEEEEEHDLQAAISAAQAAVTTGAKVETYIPTPDASSKIEDKQYHQLYKKKYKEPSTLIRFSSTVEDTTGCPYVMDEIDDKYLKEHRNLQLSEDQFEKIMWEFESITNQQLPHLHLDPSHIPEYEDFLLLVPANSNIHSWSTAPQVYEHWKERRHKRGGKSIIPSLAYEDILKHEIDPYVCFRRRETKPVRKTRRTDQQSLERLCKLRSEMEKARNLLEMVLRREKLRKEGLVLEHAVFDKTCKIRDYQRTLDIKEDDDLAQILSKKKRKISPTETGSGTTIKIPLHRLKRDSFERPEKSPLQLHIESELSRRRERDAPYEDITESPYQPFPKPLPTQFYQSLLLSSTNDSSNTISHSGPRFRRRIGRGGRVFIDRIGFHQRPSAYNYNDQKMDSENTYQFDMDSESDDTDYEFDVMDNRFLKYRTQLLNETDLRNLNTIPFLQSINPMSNVRSNQPNKQQDQQQQQSSSQQQSHQSSPQQRLVLQSTNGNTQANATSSPSTNPSINMPSSSSPSSTSLKNQNNNNRLGPQQITHATSNGMYSSSLNDSNVINRTALQMATLASHQQQMSSNLENSPGLTQAHLNGSTTPRPTTHVS
ncbi:unnamed protein product [Cunninghamella echinulata]